MTCTPIETKFGTMIVCSREPPARPCQEPGCSRTHTQLCDYPVIRKGKVTTCDRRMCDGHATKIEDEPDDTVDYCPAHARMYAKEQQKVSDNSPSDVGGSSEQGGWSGGAVRPGMSTKTLCSACRREIRWLRTEQDRPMPVDAEPQRRVVMQRPEQQQSLFGDAKAPELVGVVVECWVPHWETCTDPDRFRKDSRR